MMRKKAVILGFAGSGKTHTLALLLHNEVPYKRVSTSCFRPPVRSIGLRHFKKSSSSEFCAEISRKEFFRIMMRSGKDASSEIPRSSIKNWIGKLVLNYNKNFLPDKPARRASANLFRYSISSDEMEPLMDEVVAEITDSGGQPEFLEILPRFISGLNVAIVVTNLSERLDECSTSYFYGEDGEVVGKGEPSKITNEQMLRQFLQTVMSQSRGNSHIKFIIVGTHRDLEYMCSETREEKERKLSNMVESFGLGDNVSYADYECKKLIFAVNAKDPNEADYEMGRRVMEVVMNKDGAEIINIPLKFHLLEETLREMSTTGQIAFTVKEIMMNVKKYFNNEKSLKEGLQYLKKSNRIFYFKELFPGKVIGEPQAVLNMITEIVESHIKLTGGINTGRALDGIWKKLKMQGILSAKILKKISNAYDPYFTPEDMLKLLEELLILFKRGPEEFLMPCLLSTESSMPTFESPTENPMLQISMMLHFPKGMARMGLFCSTICKLISSEGWKHYEYSNAYRNHFSFTRHSNLGVVSLHDYFDSFFQVTLHFPSKLDHNPKLLPSTCVAIKDTVKRVINGVTESLLYEPEQPVLAFECVEQHTHSYSLHATKYIEDNYLLCTKNCLIAGKVTEWHRLWLGKCVSVKIVIKKT